MSLKNIDMDKLKADIESSAMLLILISDEYIEAMKNPEDIEHVALNYQLSVAARGEKEVYIIAFRPITRDNFNLVMDMLEGSKTKAVFFIDKDNDEDREKMTILLSVLMGGPLKMVTSRDSWVVDEEEEKE